LRARRPSISSFNNNHNHKHKVSNSSSYPPHHPFDNKHPKFEIML
jgi:hypothetical protein